MGDIDTPHRQPLDSVETWKFVAALRKGKLVGFVITDPAASKAGFPHTFPKPIYSLVQHLVLFAQSKDANLDFEATHSTIQNEWDAISPPWSKWAEGLTIGGTVVGDPVKEIIKTAFENGINMIDTAEVYSEGQSEVEIGRVVRELGYRRSDLIITTKVYWGVRHGSPNDTGLSRKHIIEGTKECLERLQMDYVDVIFAHRADNTVPMEEVVRAFNYVIEQGWAYYWGTSEWTAREIEQAHHVASKFGLVGPIAEQCEHNMFHRERPEKEYDPIYQTYGTGTTVFSALAGGLLTGKYNDGIPEGSRYATHSFLKNTVKSLQQKEGQEKIRKVRELSKLAKEEFNASATALALAWVAKNPNTSTVILGASSPQQVIDNLKALEVLPKLTPEHMERIEKILVNKPKPVHPRGRPLLDNLAAKL